MVTVTTSSILHLIYRRLPIRTVRKTVFVIRKINSLIWILGSGSTWPRQIGTSIVYKSPMFSRKFIRSSFQCKVLCCRPYESYILIDIIIKIKKAPINLERSFRNSHWEPVRIRNLKEACAHCPNPACWQHSTSNRKLNHSGT